LPRQRLRPTLRAASMPCFWLSLTRVVRRSRAMRLISAMVSGNRDPSSTNTSSQALNVCATIDAQLSARNGAGVSKTGIKIEASTLRSLFERAIISHLFNLTKQSLSPLLLRQRRSREIGVLLLGAVCAVRYGPDDFNPPVHQRTQRGFVTGPDRPGVTITADQ